MSLGAAAWADDGPQSTFGVTLTTDRPAYRAGEVIPVVLEITGGNTETVQFDFSSGQRFDFIVEDSGGREVWRWSSGRMFTAVLGQERLEPPHARLSYGAEIDASLPPGLYRIHGTLTDAHQSAVAVLVVRVE